MLLLFLLNVVAFHLSALADEGPVVKTEFGLVKGFFKLSEPNSRKFSSFLGIPYAKPPVGQFRFEPAIPADEFYKPHKPLVATSYKGDCAQLELGTLNFKGSEDCLYVNVYTPDTSFSGDLQLPVLVWIHGGGFLLGGSDPEVYGAERLLDRDIVLVTFNYRLGALGFLTTGSEDSRANVGILDQILALKWIKQNIQSFGGDSSKVTLMGQASGGDSVLALLSSPRAKGLCSQAVSMSGSYGIMNIFLHNSRKPAHYTSILATELGCDVRKSSGDILACLRGKTTEELVRTAHLFVRYNFLNNPFKPIPDPEAQDPVLPSNLRDAWNKNSQYDVPLMIGGNKDDGIISILDFISGSGEESVYSRVERNYAVEGPVLLLSTDPDLAERDEGESATAQVLRKKYLGNSSFSKESLDAITNMLTDVHFLAPIDQTVKDLLRVKTAPTFYYNYQYKGSFSLPMAFGYVDKPLGVSHADELFLIFRNSEVSKSSIGDSALQTEDDILVSRKMVDLLVEFATHGAPTKDGAWSPAEADNLQYAVLDAKQIRMEYPVEFAARMQFVQNIQSIMQNHRNVNLLTGDTVLEEMEEQRFSLAQEEKRKEFDRTQQTENLPREENQEVKDSTKVEQIGWEDLKELFPFDLEEAMKFLNLMEWETWGNVENTDRNEKMDRYIHSEEVKRIQEEEQQRDILSADEDDIAEEFQKVTAAVEEDMDSKIPDVATLQRDEL